MSLGNSGGRPRKPTALKVLEGNPGKRPLPESEPKPKVGDPRRPSWLPDKAHRYWPGFAKTLREMGVLTTVDAAGLALLTSALADWLEADEKVTEDGLTYEQTTEKGGYAIKANPAVAMRADAWRRVFVLLTQYGLTAASRAKVKAEKPPERDEFAEMFG